MERKRRGQSRLEESCEGSQSPPRAVVLLLLLTTTMMMIMILAFKFICSANLERL
jgi:hypothetical protein